MLGREALNLPSEFTLAERDAYQYLTDCQRPLILDMLCRSCTLLVGRGMRRELKFPSLISAAEFVRGELPHA